VADAPQVRLAEVVGALSLATDVGMGAPLETGLGTCLVATRLAEELGCTEDERRRAYWVALLRHIGCTAGSHEFAALVGDELAFRGGLGGEDFTDQRVLLGHVLRTMGGGSAVGRLRAMNDAARSVVAERAGSAFDPEIAACFAGRGAEVMAALDRDDLWGEMLAAEPGPPARPRPDDLERALRAVGDFADLKSPYTVGHSRAVAELASDAAAQAGLDAGARRLVLLAGLVHDVGRVGVSSLVWGKEGPLSRTEWEQVRLHPYTTERVLDRAESLREVVAVAAAHHERLDGSGYHRGVPASVIARPARLLAAADAFHAMTEPRPHRTALAPEQAAGQLRREARDGRLDGDAVEAVLAASGQPVRRRRTHAAGLTPREVEVLRLLARGLSIKAIAAELTVAPKTVDAHIQHIYAKAGVSTRAAATLFAAEHDLLETL
jgi:HD-GYP domain-containing protein (c-di-GMP phosphodiesterase class II)